MPPLLAKIRASGRGAPIRHVALGAIQVTDTIGICGMLFTCRLMKHRNFTCGPGLNLR